MLECIVLGGYSVATRQWTYPTMLVGTTWQAEVLQKKEISSQLMFSDRRHDLGHGNGITKCLPCMLDIRKQSVTQLKRMIRPDVNFVELF